MSNLESQPRRILGSSVRKNVNGTSAVFDAKPRRRDPRICRPSRLRNRPHIRRRREERSERRRADALRQLITDVQNGNAGFAVILVYDISRWGRFQDADESAYYEYLCKRAGIEVHYCASSSRTTVAPLRRSSRASSGRWPENTAVSCRRKCSRGNAG